MPLNISGGAFRFVLPVDFYPDYSRLGVQVDKYPFSFSYGIQLMTNKTITYISKPQDSKCEPSKDGCRVYIHGHKPDREIRIFYKSLDMKYPTTLFAMNY